MKEPIATATIQPSSDQVTDAAWEIERLPNLGPKSSAMLAHAFEHPDGVVVFAQFDDLGGNE